MQYQGGRGAMAPLWISCLRWIPNHRPRLQLSPESLLPCPCFKLPPLCRYEQAVGGRGTVDGVASMINMDLPSYLSLLSVTGE